MTNLKDRVSIITGGAQGIGFSTSYRLAELGSTVAILDVNAEAAEQAATKIRDAGFQAVSFSADISKPGQVEAVIDSVAAEYGRVDNLVNIAGIWSSFPFDTLGLAEWQKIFDVNVNGVFLASQAAFRHMKAAGYGRIVNIATGAFATARKEMAHYVASKGAVIGMTRVIAAEGGAYGITANTIAPGLIVTEGVRQNEDLEAVSRQVLPQQSVQRLGEPADVAEAIAFFVSPLAGFTSGQTLFVDGGQIFH